MRTSLFILKPGGERQLLDVIPVAQDGLPGLGDLVWNNEGQMRRVTGLGYIFDEKQRLEAVEVFLEPKVSGQKWKWPVVR